MFKKASWIYVVSAIILAFGLWLIIPDRAGCSPERSIEKLAQTCEITYQGSEGNTALDLLKSSYNVETKSFSFGEMVQSINGVSSPATHFWAFYVNGKQAETGADSYISKDTDTITWKLEKIQTQ